MSAKVRAFELHANGDVLHLFGAEQVAEMIALLGQAMRDAYEVDDQPAGYDWTKRWEHSPIRMECRSKLCNLKERKALISRKEIA